MSGITNSHVACSWGSIPARICQLYDPRNSMEFLLRVGPLGKEEGRACLNFFLKNGHFHPALRTGFATQVLDQAMPLRIKWNFKSCVAQMDPKLEALLYGAGIVWQSWNDEIKPPYRFVISNQVRFWRHIRPDGRIIR